MTIIAEFTHNEWEAYANPRYIFFSQPSRAARLQLRASQPGSHLLESERSARAREFFSKISKNESNN